MFERTLNREHGKSVETIFHSESQHLYKICQSLLGYFHRKKSLLVIQNILRLFVKTLTVDDKHYLFNRDNLTQPIQIQLSQKQKTFSEF